MGASKRGLRVVELPADSPASKAGVQLDDVILEVDGRPVAGLPKPEVHRLLTGEVGSVVRLRIDRRGSLSEIAVTRAPYGK
jgi:carboxyl-terminal processing protease